jgi:hypothetical protein
MTVYAIPTWWLAGLLTAMRWVLRIWTAMVLLLEM